MDERVAVARSNGNVEIWNVSSGWHMERQIPGGEELSVETLVSVCGGPDTQWPSLVVGGRSGSLWRMVES